VEVQEINRKINASEFDLKKVHWNAVNGTTNVYVIKINNPRSSYCGVFERILG